MHWILFSFACWSAESDARASLIANDPRLLQQTRVTPKIWLAEQFCIQSARNKFKRQPMTHRIFAKHKPIFLDFYNLRRFDWSRDKQPVSWTDGHVGATRPITIIPSTLWTKNLNLERESRWQSYKLCCPGASGCRKCLTPETSRSAEWVGP